MSKQPQPSPTIDQERLEDLDPKSYIIIKNANVNNLQSLSLAIKRNELVVITGVSGSGKSSLAFDTLFAEGQRMYVESLNSYARQFLGRMQKPDVEYIKGVCPAIAVEQKVATRNARSTVGTTTEIYDYLKLLFARIGITYSPISGQVVKKDSVTDVVDFALQLPEESKILVLYVFRPSPERTIKDELNLLLQKGFSRLYVDGQMIGIEDFIEQNAKLKKLKQVVYVLVDRLKIDTTDEQTQYRLSDSVQTAFYEGLGHCQLLDLQTNVLTQFSDSFQIDGIQFETPSVNLFSFNNPYGVCRNCDGLGVVLDIDPELVIPDKSMSVHEGAISPWRTEKMSEWQADLMTHALTFDFPVHRAIEDLDPHHLDLLWTGNEYFKGLHDFFAFLKANDHQIQYRVLLARYRGRTTCPDCKGTRVRKDASYVKIGGLSIQDMVLMPIGELKTFFEHLKLTDMEQQVASRILIEIRNRLEFVEKVGLSYLTLNRLSQSLSGGEFQRIKLATSLGSALVGSMYILDEPSIGLHPRDTENLIKVLKYLRDLGNTVIVVEHEEEVIRAADQLIDIGPDAGELGGKLVFQGRPDQITKDLLTHTAAYLSGVKKIDFKEFRRTPDTFLSFQGASANNIENIDVQIPLYALTVVTGVSGSGKSSLIKSVVYPALSRALGLYASNMDGKLRTVVGPTKQITHVEFVDQQPIGRSSRSNPVTYIKAYEYIRQFFSELKSAKQAGLKPGHFSFNVEGGRCESCQGEGHITIEMQFMADVHLPCEECKGKRFKEEVLAITHKGKNINDILEMTVNQALVYFDDMPKVAQKLLPLQEVGLGYIRLGQSSSTLSGGEAQRIKLASFLGKNNTDKSEHIFFFFDEPTTGLHFADIEKLLKAIFALLQAGHSVLMIEHNLEVIKSADWLIDLGPDGGDKGGKLCYQGVPEGILTLTDNYTAHYLKAKLASEK